ncbi:MAG TPA: Rne/Rng family ribonuclease [Terriglobales bacterium]|jgi:Rne/Rng family ribonuclease|nr:Rne/Rng family ribonuclease [Terriglobales bacterium]
MAKELFISTTPHETKVAVVEDEQLTEIYFERENEYTLAGSIYKGRVTRVLPGMQSAFVDIGLERDAFLYVTDFLEEQEDQEDFEQVVNRAHSDAQPELPRPQAQPAQLIEEDAAEPADSHSDGADQAQTDTSQFDRGPRRWRGRRGRRRGRGGFQDQSGPQTSAQPVPSGEEAPRASESADDEPILLPGESLSKYRQAEKTESAEQPPSAPPSRQEPEGRESTLVSTAPVERTFAPRPESTGPMQVLPGESISKYRSRGPEEAETEPAIREPYPIRERSFGRGQSRWERPSRRPERDATAPEPTPSGPPVLALPGESLAKYRGKEEAPVSASQSSHEIHSGTVVPPNVNDMEAAHRDNSGAANVSHSSAEQSGVEERVEHVFDVERRPHEAPPFERGTHEDSRSERAKSVNEPESAEQEQENASVPHEFGAGVLEEEVIDEEESELTPFGEHPDEDIYEELEEETLDAENAEQLVEAVREAHANQRLGLQQGDQSEGEERAAGEGGEGFIPEEESHDHSEQMEAADLEDANYQHADEIGAEEQDEDQETEGLKEEGRAELRAPANTAAFQQRVERPERSQQDRFRRGGRRGRPMRGRRNIQRESQPTISDLLKEGQEILVQIAKEPMAKKGARITSHIALPGRFLVYMPTVNHVGVSRKIGSDEERQRLKRVLISEKGNAHGGFIVRTAAAGASEEDLRSDLRFLINLWNDIKSRAESGKAPALIYHDLNLVERILRDQVTANFTNIWADSEQEYERIVRFLGRFQPAMVRRAKLYTKDTPLFEQFGIQEEINNALKSKVWLKSGGYIVINQTEALVAIDINTGKYVGKTMRLEDTIVKTNIDAIKEIVRQIRLRDLGGIIVIDFIDMDERKNRQKVMQALEEALKNDRAPSKVLQFNDFGLVAITRKRVKQSLERTLSTSCTYCTGTGMIKSVQTVCNEIYVEMRKMARQMERHDVMLRVNPEVVKALKANNARWLQEMEELAGKTIIVKSDPVLHQEQFDIN